ncbi:MAG: DUF2452 domain-containing protein [Bacteroidetes bacterium]|nr:MAG: DUF2452 domain-containing protein [Bacteroidota bacterium]
MNQKSPEEAFQNPIDPEKVAENPGTLPYAHTVGGVAIRPEDKGKIKGRAMSAMYEQTQMQMDQIREQIELLAQQAQALQQRVQISERIYEAETGFEPRVGHTYHLYERKNGQWLLSMVGPDEWGRSFPFSGYVASVRLLADHTWDIVETGEAYSNGSK